MSDAIVYDASSPKKHQDTMLSASCTIVENDYLGLHSLRTAVWT